MAAFANRNLTLNLSPGSVPPVLYVSQYDSGYQVNFQLYNGSTPFEIPDDVNVRLDMTKSDGNGLSASIVKSSIDSSKCYLWMILQMTTCSGDQTCEVVLVHRDDERRIGTANFIMRVETAALRNNAIVSQSQISYVQQKIDQWAGLAAYGDALDGALNRITATEGDVDSIESDITELQNGKAPNNHASTGTTYGVGTQYSYGHLKLWGNTSSDPPATGQYALDAQNFTEFYRAMLQTAWVPSGDYSAPGWAYGWRFVSADSRAYCRCAANCIYTVTFTARVGNTAINAGVSSSIITNLPEAATRIYVQAYFVTYVDGVASAVTPVMCAIRPENTDITNPARTLQIDGPTNPVQVPAGATVFGTFTYVSSR